MSAIQKTSKWIENLQLRYYNRKLKKLSTVERLVWADYHPIAKRLLGLRGMNDLSILELASLPRKKIDADIHQALITSCLYKDEGRAKEQ